MVAWMSFCCSILIAGRGLAASVDVSRLPAAVPNVDFQKDVLPILETACFKCHGPEKSKNGLRLDSRAAALKGGEQGVDIVPGDGASSPLLHYVAGLVPDMEMPPKGKGDRLTSQQLAILRGWIDQGALWNGPEASASDPHIIAGAGKENAPWWSLKPLVRPAVPVPPSSGARLQNPIDAFVLSTLSQKGLSPSPPADARTLIRRVYFDLIGLPPTPEAVDRFVADGDPQAYEHLVDSLLASPRYGERWARHWLDVVHYGETHGYDKDQPRPNAWPYRDYVIRSFNQDKPYGRFLEEQVAGDVLFPGSRDGFEALGFLSAGPWDLIGHAEVPETKIDGKVARHLDRDDMVVNTLQTFNSLTVQCAQCHNHKFDPITQEDYYSLQAVFAAVDRADKPYDKDPEVASRRKELEGLRTRTQQEQTGLESNIAARVGKRLSDLDAEIAAATKASKGGTDGGYHSSIEKRPNVTKWVQADLGTSTPIGSVVLHACHDDFNGIGDGFGFPARYRVEVSDDAQFLTGVTVVTDQTRQDAVNPKLKPVAFDAGGVSARYLRVTATQLALRQDDYIFALAELEVLGMDGRNLARGAAVTALDSIEAPPRWAKPNLTDGNYPGASPAGGPTLASLQDTRNSLLEAATTPAEKARLEQLKVELTKTRQALESLPPQSQVYVAAVHKGSGAFTGTGGSGGKPRPIHVLSRGNILKPGKEVGPGTLSCLSGLPSRFNIAPDQPEGERRAALARWLVQPGNPLTWRSMVNRVWQYHFGRGLVETPNDFGRMGSLPSHPELLDWLATEFRDGGQSIKSLHRLIVTSATYRQSSGASAASATAMQADSENRYLWRQNRRKLEAEAIRDAILQVSGKLDLAMGGPSFKDFVVEHPEHSPHYEYHLHDPEDPKSHRRSIYRFIVRSQQQPFMTVLDCADPSMQVGRRNESLSPLQALSLLNNSLILSMSRYFAADLARRSASVSEQVTLGYRQALGRDPHPSEREALTRYAEQFGMTNSCRVLLNLSEFAFVD